MDHLRFGDVFHGQRNKDIILLVDVHNKIITSDWKYVTVNSVDCPVRYSEQCGLPSTLKWTVWTAQYVTVNSVECPVLTCLDI
jgi:hypothetical protein